MGSQVIVGWSSVLPKQVPIGCRDRCPGLNILKSFTHVTTPTVTYTQPTTLHPTIQTNFDHWALSG